MKMPQDYAAKRCWTAAGCLIHQGKVLLIKHKKVKRWLNPGGHIDPDELPHQAAEREFWEETGVRVQTRSVGYQPPTESEADVYVPVPVTINLHWISREHYQARQEGITATSPEAQLWQRGCEQHLCLLYLLEVTAENETDPEGYPLFKQNVEETDGIGWFTEAEIDKLEIGSSIAGEIHQAFSIANSR